MLGWTMVFGLIAVLAWVMDVVAGPATAAVSTKLAMLVFGVLFLACLLTNVVRGRA